MTDYFASIIRDKSINKRIYTHLHLQENYAHYNFEIREKKFELKTNIISPSIEQFYEQGLSRSAKEKAIHFTLNSNEQNQTQENCFELPDGEKILFENGFEFDRYFFDKKEQNPRSIELQGLLSDSLSACDVDIRKNIISGIMLTGGNSLIPKFKERLEEILNNILVGSTKAKLITPAKAADRKLSSWLGGSILSSTGAFQNMWIGKIEYDEVGESILDRKCLN